MASYSLEPSYLYNSGYTGLQILWTWILSQSYERRGVESWDEICKDSKCDLYSRKIFFEPLLHARDNFRNWGDTKVEEEEKKMTILAFRSYILMRYINKRFWFYSLLILEATNFALSDSPCSSAGKPRRTFWSKGSNDLGLAELPCELSKALPCWGSCYGASRDSCEHVRATLTAYLQALGGTETTTMARRNLTPYSPWGHKELDTT